MSNPDDGFIKLYRGLLENPIMCKPNYLAVWMYILLRANYKDRDIIVENENKMIPAGSFLGSLQGISKHFKISVNTVKNIVDYFCSVKMLYTERTHKYTIFNVLNWEKYQSCTLGEHWENTERTLAETNKNLKKERSKALKALNTSVDSLFEDEKIQQPSPEEIYQAYPRKVAKEAAIKAIEKAAGKISLAELLAAVSEYSASILVKTTPKEFIPHPATWINRGSWADDRAEWNTPYGSRNVRQSIHPAQLASTSSQPCGLWASIEASLTSREIIPKSEIDDWFENAQALIDNGWLVIGVDSQFRRNHIESEYAEKILQAFRETSRSPVEGIEIILTGKLAEAAGCG